MIVKKNQYLQHAKRQDLKFTKKKGPVLGRGTLVENG